MMRVVQVIEASVPRGDGTRDDPFRHVVQYWSFDGKLLAEDDCWARSVREIDSDQVPR